MRKPIISAEQKIWTVIDVMKQQYRLTDFDLATKLGVSSRTVRRDRMNPDSIPLSRLVKYLSIGASESQIVSSIESLVMGGRVK